MAKTQSTQATHAALDGPLFSILATVGSLWFAGLMLMLLLIGMACATVFESQFGTEQALARFYGSWWFKLLLVLTGVSVAAALALRLPFNRRQLGFVLTHGGLLAVMAGAIATMVWGVNGQVAVGEGETVDAFQVRRDVLSLASRRDNSEVSAVLADRAFGGFRAVEQPKAPTLSAGDLNVSILRYVPDSTSVERVVDDNPRLQPAIKVSLGGPTDQPQWIFADQSVKFGPRQVAFRAARDEDELTRLLVAEASPEEAGVGLLRIEHAGQTHELAVADCTAAAAPLGKTGLSVRVLRYLPHATVAADNQVINASDRPVNPAVEVEITGPDGAERRISFAKFPDFQSMHGKAPHSDVKVVFVAQQTEAAAPVELIGGPDGRLFVRYSADGAGASALPVTLGELVETPWPQLRLMVHQRFEHARVDRPLEEVSPVRENRIPAILVRLTSGSESSDMWLQRGSPRPVSIHGTPYEVVYGDQSVKLGFALRLNDFKVVRYPGGQTPRSFESNITLVDPTTGDTRDQIVSMNHPVKYAGFTVYQSSYFESGRSATSVLSVARDPGQPLVFAGYILTFVGMLVVLYNRMRERKLMAAWAARTANA